MVCFSLERETRFVEITEAVHSRVLHPAVRGVARLRADAHTVFTELSLEGERWGPGPASVGAAVRLSRGGGEPRPPGAGLRPQRRRPGEWCRRSWENRSRSAASTRRTFHDPVTGWLVTTVGPRGQDWAGSSSSAGPPPPRRMSPGGAGGDHACAWLSAPAEESLERQMHCTMPLWGIIHAPYSGPARSTGPGPAAAAPLAGRTLVVVVLRLRDAGTGLATQARLAEAAENVARGVAGAAGCPPSWRGSLDDLRVGVLLALAAPPSGLRARCHWTGSPPRSSTSTPAAEWWSPWGHRLTTIRRRAVPSFLQVGKVRDVAVHQAAGPPLPPAVRPAAARPAAPAAGAMTEAGCRPMWSGSRSCCSPTTPRRRRPHVDPAGRVHLDAGRNNAPAASRAHLSRPCFLRPPAHRIARILGPALDLVGTSPPPPRRAFSAGVSATRPNLSVSTAFPSDRNLLLPVAESILNNQFVKFH